MAGLSAAAARTDLVGQHVAGTMRGGVAEVLAQDRRDVGDRDAVARGARGSARPAAAGSVIARRCRSATSRTSTTANDRRGMPGAHPALEQSADHLDRGGAVGAEHRAEDADGVDDGQLQSPPSRAMKSHAARSASVLDLT